MRYLLVTFFVAGMYLLAGCGGSQQQESTQTEQPQKTEQTATPSAEPAGPAEELPPQPADTAKQK